MRVLDLWSGVTSWRWTPTVGLASGAVIYAVTAILLVPDHIGAEPARGALESGRAPNSGSALTTTAAVASETMADGPDTDSPAARRAARRAARLDAAQAKRGFSPPLPRPEAAAPPPAPEPAAPPPPPPPPPEPVPPPPAPPVNPPSSTQRVEVSPNVPAAEAPAAPAPADNTNAQAGNAAPPAEAGVTPTAPPAQ
jgi:hypothetical protein